MSNILLSTPNEAAYRLLLALSVWPVGTYTARWISAVDFISEYGAVFGISETNLHGNNGLKFTEYVVRLETVDQALRRLVLSGWATVSVGKTGYMYSVTDAGRNLALQFQTSYARSYRQAAEVAYERFGHMIEQELDKTINRVSVEIVAEENSHD